MRLTIQFYESKEQKPIVYIDVGKEHGESKNVRTFLEGTQDELKRLQRKPHLVTVWLEVAAGYKHKERVLQALRCAIQYVVSGKTF